MSNPSCEAPQRQTPTKIILVYLRRSETFNHPHLGPPRSTHRTQGPDLHSTLRGPVECSRRLCLPQTHQARPLHGNYKQRTNGYESTPHYPTPRANCAPAVFAAVNSTTSNIMSRITSISPFWNLLRMRPGMTETSAFYDVLWIEIKRGKWRQRRRGGVITKKHSGDACGVQVSCERFGSNAQQSVWKISAHL